MIYEWDPEKNLANQKKHGVSFETAARVFEDEDCIVAPDYAHSIDEHRYIAIGRVDNILFVVFTERVAAVRLISARVANKRERSVYYAGNLYHPGGPTLDG